MPSSCRTAGNHTTAGTTSLPGTSGATVSRCSTPFCSTHTTVAGPQSARSQPAADAVCVAFTASRTRSAGSRAPPGSVCTGPGTTTRPRGESSVSPVLGERPATNGVRPCSWSAAATVVPIAPGPTTATRGWFVIPRR